MAGKQPHEKVLQNGVALNGGLTKWADSGRRSSFRVPRHRHFSIVDKADRKVRLESAHTLQRLARRSLRRQGVAALHTLARIDPKSVERSTAIGIALFAASSIALQGFVVAQGSFSGKTSGGAQAAIVPTGAAITGSADSPSSRDRANARGHSADPAARRSDRLLEQLRGHPAADRLFTAASHLGDFSLIWHLVGIARGIARRRPDQVLVRAALLGVESLIVNQGVKRLFRRERPTVEGDERLRVRRPSTSAFPSGHASSAVFAATILTRWDGRRLGALWFSIAAIVGVSRAYVRIHHASDVAGGAIVGRLLGLVAWAAVGRRVAGRVR